MNINVEQDFSKLNGSQKTISPTLYNKPTICDKVNQPEVPKVSLMPIKAVLPTMPKEVVATSKMKHKGYYLSSIPIDKLWIQVDKDLPLYEWRLIRDDYKTFKLHKKIRKTFWRDQDKSFILKGLNHPVAILSNSRFTQIQFNPKFHSLPFIKLLPLVIFGKANFKLTHCHINLDLRIPISELKQRIRVGSKKCVETYNPGLYTTRYSPKAGMEVLLPLSTEYLGKNNRVALYDSGVKHKLGVGVSRAEIRFNQEKRLNYLKLDQLDLLIEVAPFRNISLPLTYKKVSVTNQKHIKYFHDFMVDHSVTSKEAIAEIRRSNKSKADSILRAFRLRDRYLFDFEYAYKENFKLFEATTLSTQEMEFIQFFIMELKK